MLNHSVDKMAQGQIASTRFNYIKKFCSYLPLIIQNEQNKH